MNHFISGILKLSLLEASLALLLAERVAGARFEKAWARVSAWLAGLMLFAWCNYGGLRGGPGVRFGWVLAGGLVCLGAAWLVRAGRGEAKGRVASALQGALAARRVPPLAAAVAATVVAAGGWLWAGHQAGGLTLVHAHEQFHFYLGAKYQAEVGWFELYRAALLADRETVGVLREATQLRDNHTFELEPVAAVLADAPRVRARFSDERWLQFTADWVAFTQRFPMPWAQVVTDHGNSNSPAWSLFAAPLARLAPVGLPSQSYLGWIDLLLMLVLFTVALDTFGSRVASAGVFFFAAVPFVFDYLAGSLLRWDWLFATGLAACFLARQRFAAAGAFFGYAVATKLFPLFFGLALAARALLEARQTGRLAPRHLRFALGATAAGALTVMLSAAAFGPSAWGEYAERIGVAQREKFYSNQYSLKTVYLQLTNAAPDEGPLEVLLPREMKQARPDVDPSQQAVGLWLARVLATLAVLVLVRRASDVEAFSLGPYLVFTWLTVNAYYWNMLALAVMGLVLRRARGPTALLVGTTVTFMGFYLYQHLNRGFAEGYVVGLGLLLSLGVAGALEAWALLRPAKPASPPDEAAPG